MTVKIIATLAESGHHITLLHHRPEFATQLHSQVERVSLPHDNRRVLINPIHLLRQLSLVRRYLLSTNPNLVIVAQGYPESGITGLIAGRLMKRNVISYIPFGYTADELRKPFGAYRKYLQLPIIRAPHGHITIDQVQADLLQRHLNGSNHPLYIVHNPAELNIAPLADDLDRNEPLTFGVIGRINFSQKNQSIVPKIACRLSNKKANVGFRIIGSGPDQSALEATISRLKLNNIKLVSSLEHSQLLDYIQESIDVVLITSHYEGFPLVFLEALALGKPIMTTPLDFLKPFSVPSYMIIDPDDPDLTTKRIISFAEKYQKTDYETLRQEILTKHTHSTFLNEARNIPSFFEKCFHAH